MWGQMGLTHPSPQNRLGRPSRGQGFSQNSHRQLFLGQGEGQASNLKVKVEAVASW